MSDFETIVGQLVVERGLVPQEKLVECLKEVGTPHPDADTSLAASRLSDVLVEKGYLKKEQVDALRKEVADVITRGATPQILKRDQVKLGQLLLGRKLVTPEHLDECLQAQRTDAKGVPLGEILVKRGYVAFDALEKLVKEQGSRITLACEKCQSPHSAAGYDPNRKYVCTKCGGTLAPPPRITHPPVLPEAVVKCARNPKNHFGKYVLIRELGRGGMGAVYEAWDTKLNRRVAIKVLLSQKQGDIEVERFYREAQTAASLKHENIVAIFEVDQHDRRHYIAMEYIEGKLLAGERLPVRRACEILKDVAHAVEYAHARGIIHRDLKPQNIILGPDGQPHVMDFGLAKSLSGESTVTMAGTVIGTPSYMPPEQAAGKLKQLDRRSDVWALGAILYEMVTGRPPFKGATPVETLKHVLEKDPTPPSTLNKHCPGPVEAIILKAMEKDKEARYDTAKSFARDLQSFLNGSAVVARRTGGVTRLRKQIGRNKPAIAGAVVAIAIAAIAAISWARSGLVHADRVRERLAAAQGLFDKDDFEGARRAFLDVETLDPGNSRSRAMVKKCDEKLAAAARVKPPPPPPPATAAGPTESERDRMLAAAQPEFSAGQRKVESTALDLYKPGADLTQMKRTLDEAIAHFTSAIGVYALHGEAFRLRARARALRHDFEGALDDYSKAIELMPRNGAAYWERGRLCLQKFMDVMTARGWQTVRGTLDNDVWLKRALPDIEQAQKLGGLGDESDFAEACIAYGKSRMDEAISACDRALQKNATKEEAFKLRGDARYQQSFTPSGRVHGPLAAAIRDWTSAIELRANYFEAYVMRGAAQFDLRQLEAAGDDFKKAHAIHPGDTTVNLTLGIYCIHKENQPGAERYLDRAIELDPKFGRAYTFRCILRIKQQRFQEAMDDANKALSIEPDDATALYHRGELHAIAGRFREAIADLERCLELGHPSRAEIRKLIERCRQ